MPIPDSTVRCFRNPADFVSTYLARRSTKCFALSERLWPRSLAQTIGSAGIRSMASDTADIQLFPEYCSTTVFIIQGQSLPPVVWRTSVPAGQILVGLSQGQQSHFEVHQTPALGPEDSHGISPGFRMSTCLLAAKSSESSDSTSCASHVAYNSSASIAPGMCAQAMTAKNVYDAFERKTPRALSHRDRKICSEAQTQSRTPTTRLYLNMDYIRPVSLSLTSLDSA